MKHKGLVLRVPALKSVKGLDGDWLIRGKRVDAGHFALDEANDQVAALILSFLDKQY
jgi:hypothetical protein